MFCDSLYLMNELKEISQKLWVLGSEHFYFVTFSIDYRKKFMQIDDLCCETF